MDVEDARPTTDPLAALSKRERQILSMTTRGLSNRQIAMELKVTVHAVKFHLASIFRKLHVANRTEAAVAFAQSTGMLGLRGEGDA